jgi:hypothetical protein
VQASGSLFEVSQPDSWTLVFGGFVTDEEGAPITGLARDSFFVWDLSGYGEIKIQIMEEINALFPASHMPGVYRLQTFDAVTIAAPAPQEFVCAIRVSQTTAKVPRQGMITVPVTYLGLPR